MMKGRPRDKGNNELKHKEDGGRRRRGTDGGKMRTKRNGEEEEREVRVRKKRVKRKRKKKRKRKEKGKSKKGEGISQNKTALEAEEESRARKRKKKSREEDSQQSHPTNQRGPNPSRAKQTNKDAPPSNNSHTISTVESVFICDGS